MAKYDDNAPELARILHDGIRFEAELRRERMRHIGKGLRWVATRITRRMKVIASHIGDSKAPQTREA